ncbi:hypothetical protein EIP86_003588 [Pleurotus ostreatoroseus]|nr:hypothetical protein EIP86_003588 [Pleurotus ostreatoroseus]
MDRKRSHSITEAEDTPCKRQEREVIVIDDDDEQEESLEHILELIAQQEASEALAQNLQKYDDSVPGPSHAGPSISSHPEVIDVDDEDDEAMARRLAREWAEEDVPAPMVDLPHALVSDTPLSQPPVRTSGDNELLTTPDIALKDHRCFKVIPCAAPCKGKDKECPVLTCCAEVRAIALFEALGSFDRHYLGELATSNSRSKEAAAAYRANTAASVGPGGTGYGTGSYETHSPYGARRTRARAPPAPATSSMHTTWANHWDEIIVRALNTITMLLPAPYDDAAQIYDMLPHASITSLLQLSQLPLLLAGLLRNDSVTDWITRVNVLIGGRYEMKTSSGVEAHLWGEEPITWETVNDEAVKVQPLYIHFQKLTKQCETFMAGANKMLQDAPDGPAGEDVEDTIKGASLCGEIIVARDDIERAMRVLGKDPKSFSETAWEDVNSSSAENQGKDKDKGKGVDAAINMERQYRLACEKLAFEHVAFPQEGTDYTTFKYNQELKQTSSATRNPKDRLHLIKELAVMATSLPSGVWVRVDEVRNDALKIMIAGPEGTPYEGGLFEFDCFLPLEYPHKPPLMHLRTTGGGTVRFNPNLYNNGKVCLSLLGTWPGRPEEQWSSKSTLLQVLVSIQSMILVELPYFNDRLYRPGFGKAVASHPGSVEYNRTASANTVRWAIVEWLKNEHRNGIWSVSISKSIEKWAKSDPRIRNFTPQSAYRLPGFPIPINPHMSVMDTLPMTESFAWMGLPPPYAPLQPHQPPKAPAQPANSSGMDLLSAFDKGIQTIRTWPQTWKT